MFKNFKVGTKLLAGFLSISVIGALVALVGIFNMGRISDLADDMYEKEVLGISHIKEANINLIYIGRARGNFLLSTTDAERQTNLANIKKYSDTLKGHLEKAKPLFVTAEAKALFDRFENEAMAYEKSMARVLTLGAKAPFLERSAELSAAMVETRKDANVLDDLLTEISKRKEIRAKAAADESKALYRFSLWFMLGLVAASMAIGTVLGLLITRGLNRQLGGEPAYAASVASRIAEGDLTVEIETDNDNKGSLLFALQNMRDSLSRIIGSVRMGTDTIATASNQIAAGNLDLSSRTEQQASSLEETAASMEELTSTVKQTSDNARHAKQLADSAAGIAVRGGEVVAEVMTTMSAISESSGKIVDIISVIDGIAFQTNILALNAAVEAARAGEQGRGFAVVATEVRNLAQRSASAAKEIKTLINDSVMKVEVGSKLVGNAGATMNEIVGSINRVNDIMAEISAASVEQSQGIGQVNEAVVQMDQVTQQNAALVEEAAAAAASLNEQARVLSLNVDIFKLGTAARTAHAEPSNPLPAALTTHQLAGSRQMALLN